MKRRAGEEGIDKILSEFGVDAIVAPMDSPIFTVAALAGKLLDGRLVRKQIKADGRTEFSYRLSLSDCAPGLPFAKRAAFWPMPRCQSTRRGKTFGDHECL